MSIKLYKDNTLYNLSKSSIPGVATQTTDGLMSATDKKRIDNISSKISTSTVTLYSNTSWTSTPPSSGTLSSAYTNFDFIVLEAADMSNKRLQLMWLPTAYIKTNWDYMFSQSYANTSRRITVRFTSTTAWKKGNINDITHGIRRIIGVGRKSW
jgi:hypothetical protein